MTNQQSNFCNCPEPQHSDEWVPLGGPDNTMDYQVCADCNLPIQGTQSTHQE